MASSQQQIKEIIRCGKDPKYFINKYVKIQHPINGTTPFTTYPFQDSVIDDLEEYRFNVIVKGRQLGISTVTAAYALWLALFHRDKNILCIATKLKTAQNFIAKVKFAFNQLPKWLVLKPKNGDSKQHISFENGSQVKAIPKSEDAGRSEAVSLLIVDEAAHIEGFDTIWTALLPGLSTGGKAVMLSSPNGVGGVFHKTYVDAVAGINGWHHIELKWDVHPERDEAWFEEQKKLFSTKELCQEHLCEFNGSGDTYVSVDDLAYLKSIMRPPIRRDGPSGQVWIWCEPSVEHKYVMSADVARGDLNGDYSAFHIFDNSAGEVAAEYMGHIRPDAFGKLLDEWGRRYHNALMVPELNTYGHHTITVLLARDYPNMYYEQRQRDPAFYPGPDDIPGFSMSGRQLRERVLARMEEVIRNRLIRSYSQRLYDQLLTFVEGQRRAEAKRGTHDDLVMSFAIGANIIDIASIDESARRLAYILLEATSRSSNVYAGVDGLGRPMSEAYTHAAGLVRGSQDKPGLQPTPRPPGMSVDMHRVMGQLSWLL